MSKFVLTRQAEDDLFEIWDYLAQKDIDAADRMRDTLEREMNRLAEFPASATCVWTWRTSDTGSGWFTHI